VIERVRDTRAGVPTDYLYREVARPLLANNGQALLGPDPDAGLKAAAAKLCAAVGADLYRNADAWSLVEGLKARPTELAERLYDRAVSLDRKAEYLAMRGILRSLSPGFDLGQVEKDCAEAAAADDGLALTKALQGIVAALKAE